MKSQHGSGSHSLAVSLAASLSASITGGRPLSALFTLKLLQRTRFQGILARRSGSLAEFERSKAGAAGFAMMPVR